MVIACSLCNFAQLEKGKGYSRTASVAYEGPSGSMYVAPGEETLDHWCNPGVCSSAVMQNREKKNMCAWMGVHSVRSGRTYRNTTLISDRLRLQTSIGADVQLIPTP